MGTVQGFCFFMFNIEIMNWYFGPEGQKEKSFFYLYCTVLKSNIYLENILTFSQY